MKHATPATLNQIEELLEKLRGYPLKERSRGTFYRGSSAFLHFHEDPAGMFADLKLGGDFERFRVSTRTERAAFLRAVATELAQTAGRSRDTRRSG